VLPLVRLGLTGGIGSGKSTIAKLLANNGAVVVDADAISRNLTGPGGAAMSSIVAEFGQNFVTGAGALDRDTMRSLVYTDATARHRLEAIIHPLVAIDTEKQAAAYAAQGRQCIVFDIPLLVESPSWRHKVDHVLVVDCTPEVQIKRVMARSQMTRPEIEKIMASQIERLRRLGAADSVIFNVGLSIDELADEVLQISPRFGLSSD
jgi:dephospho-CoA kinase